jgi:hypothetical protein
MSPKQKSQVESTLTEKHIETHVAPMLRYFETLPKPAQKKSAAEIAEIRQASSKALAAGDADCQCWFKDSNGGDFCVPYSSPVDCKSAGGTPVPGDCPNFFAALKASRGLAKILAKKPPVAKLSGKTPARNKK